MMRDFRRFAGALLAASIVLIGCDIDGPLRDDFSYRLTVTVAASGGIGLGNLTIDVSSAEPGLIDEEPPGSGVFVAERISDYDANPHVVEIDVASGLPLAGDETFSVTVTYSDLGMIPVTTRTIFRARREAGDGLEPEIWKQIVVPQ